MVVGTTTALWDGWGYRHLYERRVLDEDIRCGMNEVIGLWNDEVVKYY